LNQGVASAPARQRPTGCRCQAHSSQCLSGMNTEETEIQMQRAASMLCFGVEAVDVAAIFRAEGSSEETIYLVITAARILARP